MRGQPLNNQTTHPLLGELPVFAPDADLWPRIAAAHAKSQRTPRRRGYRWAAIAATVAIALGAAVMVPRLQHGPEQGPALADGQRESQSLEREWQTLAPSGARPAAGLARLHVIDTALQSAYDRGARPDELQPLWQQRNDALRGLILVARTDTITRI